ncbi:bifunctional acetate--CoA ligase family protein/GNAT family N-acetyltransferase [Sinorhizobium alkalisoli]|uniref:Acetyltransferase n=1 Tax=Sinorhizobium alkalisoli TaxID=1752398 RepID=A0A1E3V7S3_9HYPH|nr:bifunctional acetate--CoA ligase family protein/GNAT family N-acetyltransferase [Sinorhizobium alkalisoli]MCA1490506.1 bifunctional acetate--CoA ligase family protein/GNAT family N-acetyltransferase [Ensifer sp. NBAIM29]ODR89525.1 acetyltransferase [Sinorhizobium alkalisoli]
MTIRNLHHAIDPKSLAVIGASSRQGSLGRVVIENVLAMGFGGNIWPVNPKYSEVAGLICFARVADIPGVPDLAVIVTPPQTIPGLIRDLGERGTRAAVVITAGLSDEKGLRQAMLDAAKPHLFRIIGPNTVGLIVPAAKLNASFVHLQPQAGDIALLSQSGAIATSLIDWAADNNIGFSQIVSLGDMADVDAADCLDLLAGDPKTRAIVMYLEAVPNPRKFLSAARAAARLKPVVAIKSGRHAEAAKAAATHTGALSGADRVVDAALRRAGVLRIESLGELFNATETIGRFAPLKRTRAAIVTNGGGAGVLAVDRLVDFGCELAELSAETIRTLDQVLPANWSRANPVDIIGDASPERYRAATEIVAQDPATDILIVMNCPTGLASPLEAARAVASLSQSGTIAGKPVLTCWLGSRTARDGRQALQEAKLASYDTPADVALAASYLANWSRAQEALLRVPPSRAGDTAIHDSKTVMDIIRRVASEGRRMLNEPEAKTVIAAYGIATPTTLVAASPEETERAAAELLGNSAKVVVKLLSKAVSHKSDVGGVVLDIATAAAAREAAETIVARLKTHDPNAVLEGFAVQPMIERRRAWELILGTSRDPVFGPIILFGSGGVSVEVVADTAVALPPLDDVLADDLIERTRIGRLLAGFRDQPPAHRTAVLSALCALSQMIVDFPAIVSMDINPLLADEEGAIALDARIEIDPHAAAVPGPNRDLAIRPYPAGWEREVVLGARAYRIRPIRPADAALYPAFFARTAPDDIRLRFLAPRKSFPHQMLVRLTQIDYEREMAFIALERESGELAGIARLYADPDHERAEYGLLVRTDLQGQGLGWALLAHLRDYAAADGLQCMEGIMLSENSRMQHMCREFGFSIRQHPSDPRLQVASLDLEPGSADGDTRSR